MLADSGPWPDMSGVACTDAMVSVQAFVVACNVEPGGLRGRLLRNREPQTRLPHVVQAAKERAIIRE
jgi:hypothetical protein